MQELGRNNLNSNFDSAMLRSLRLSIFPATFRDVPSKIEGVIPEHRNVRYVYYNKIIMIIVAYQMYIRCTYYALKRLIEVMATKTYNMHTACIVHEYAHVPVYIHTV